LLAVTNSTVTATVTVSSVSVQTSTVINTVTHSETIQAQPFLLFGLPPELLAIFTIAIVVVIWAFFRFNVKGVPVMLIWIYKNGSALMMRAQEDLQGIFLNVMKGSKKVETLKKTGLPLQVKYLPNKFSAYIDIPKDQTINDEVLKRLRDKGFKMSPTKWSRKGIIKAYLIEKEASLVGALAYLDVNLGGMKTARLYTGIEGTGETIDWMPKIQSSQGVDPGNAVIIHEMRSAAKAILADIAAALKGTFQALILPLIAGAGIGGMLVIILVILTGHLR